MPSLPGRGLGVELTGVPAHGLPECVLDVPAPLLGRGDDGEQPLPQLLGAGHRQRGGLRGRQPRPAGPAHEGRTPGGGRLRPRDALGGRAALLLRLLDLLPARLDLRDVEAVERGWDEIKKTEKQRRSPTEGVSRSQPASSWGAALARRAERAGRAGLSTPAPADLSVDSPEELGERLLAVVTAAEQRGWDAEDALREAVRRYAGELDAAAEAAAKS